MTCNKNALIQNRREFLREGGVTLTSDLFTSALAHNCSMANQTPEAILPQQKQVVLLTPVLAERPREDLVLEVLLILLHVIRQVPARYIYLNILRSVAKSLR